MSLKLHSAFQAPSKRELAQTESPVDFPCKLSSERVTRASVLAVFLEHLPEFFLRKMLLFWPFFGTFAGDFPAFVAVLVFFGTFSGVFSPGFIVHQTLPTLYSK